nr:ABC transporter substrate-binding protein [Carboxydothermus hydrogenoformans]
MRKSFLTVMTVGLLAFLLLFTSACGNKSSESDTIKIGANLELSGNVATLGQSGLNGIMLAVEEINNSGGVLGKKIEIVKYDNKSDNTEAASVATRLITRIKL